MSFRSEDEYKLLQEFLAWLRHYYSFAPQMTRELEQQLLDRFMKSRSHV